MNHILGFIKLIDSLSIHYKETLEGDSSDADTYTVNIYISVKDSSIWL